MKSPVVKRSVMIADHRTSVSLEAAFWQDIGAEQRLTLGGLIESTPTGARAICPRRSACSCSITIAG